MSISLPSLPSLLLPFCCLKTDRSTSMFCSSASAAQIPRQGYGSFPWCTCCWNLRIKRIYLTFRNIEIFKYTCITQNVWRVLFFVLSASSKGQIEASCSALLSLQLKDADDSFMLLFSVFPAQIFDQKGFDLLFGPLESPRTLEDVRCLASSLLFSLPTHSLSRTPDGLLFCFCSSNIRTKEDVGKETCLTYYLVLQNSQKSL